MLQIQIAAIWRASGATYGSPRIVAELKRAGIRVGRRRVIAVMRAAGIAGCGVVSRDTKSNRKNRRRVRCDDAVARCVRRDAVRRAFQPGEPERVWFVDVTYMPTVGSSRFLAVVLDLGSRRVVGWQLSRWNDADLAVDCLRAALRTAGTCTGLIVHSDRGGEFANRKVMTLFAEAGVTASMSRRGNCWDNAVMESFFGTLKREWFYPRSPMRVADMAASLGGWIDWYNNERRHTSLGHRTPAEWEAGWREGAIGLADVPPRPKKRKARKPRKKLAAE